MKSWCLRLVAVASFASAAATWSLAGATHLTLEELDRYQRLRGQSDDDLHRVRFAFEGDEVEACFYNRASGMRVFEINWSIRDWSEEKKQYGGRLRVTRKLGENAGANEWACSRLNTFEEVGNSGGYCTPCVYVVHVQALWHFDRGAERIGENTVAVRFVEGRPRPTLQFERMYRGWEP